MHNILLHSDFEQCVLRNPEATALIFGNESISYRDLDNKANQLANFLIEKNLQVGSIIGLHFRPCIEQIISVLAVLKIGAAYLPLDLNYPKDRLQYILEDSGATFLLTGETDCHLKFPSVNHQIITENLYKNYSGAAPKIVVDETNLCYVIYTSGSTGKPKGVMIEHRNVYNTISQMNNIFTMEPNDGVLLNTPLGFDPSVWQIFWPLSNSGKIIICEQLQDPQYFIELIQKYQLRILHAGPTLFRMIFNQQNISECTHLKLVIGGGEAWQVSDFHTLKKFLPHCQLANVYGPTEASIHAIFWLSVSGALEPINEIPIGKPLNNIQTLIVDENMKQVAIGQVGELYLAGQGIARGYLNQPQLTSERFIHFPTEDDQRYYRTGDLVKVLPNGNLVFSGRVDDQIKLRGFRIEPGEIEKLILNLPSVKDVCVMGYKFEETQKMAAVIALHQPSPATAQENIHTYLKEKLPGYMIPSDFLIVDSIPMTANNKVDKEILKTLINNQEKLPTRQVDDPNISRSELLSRLWCEELNLEAISPEQDFFDLGGDSLSGLDLMARINSELGLDLSITTLFKQPTIKGLLEHIAVHTQPQIQSNDYSFENISENFWPLSDNQKWLLRMAKNSTIINNIVIPFRLKQEINETILRQAMENLINSHEILQKNVVSVEGKLRLVTQKNKCLAFYFDDISALTESQQTEELQASYNQLNTQSIDLAEDCLFQVALFKCSSDNFYVYIYMHHLISDPASGLLAIKYLINEYHSIHSQTPSNVTSTSFLEYIKFEAQQKHSLEYQRLLEEWSQKLNRNLYFNFGEIDENDLTGAYFEAVIPQSTTLALKKFSKDKHITLFITLLSLLKLALFNLYQQQYFAIGVNISKRDNKKWSTMIGPLSEQFISIIDFAKVQSFDDLIVTTTESIHQIYRLGITIESVYQKLCLNQSTNHIFNILFDYEKVPGQLPIENIQLLPIQSASLVRRHLSVRIVDYDDYLKLQIRYRKNLFSEVDIEKIVTQILRVSEQIMQMNQASLVVQ